MNKVKKQEIALPLEVRVFIQFIQLWKWSELVYLVCLGIKKSVNEDLSLLINISYPKLKSAPLIMEFESVFFPLDMSKMFLLRDAVLEYIE